MRSGENNCRRFSAGGGFLLLFPLLLFPLLLSSSAGSSWPLALKTPSTTTIFSTANSCPDGAGVSFAIRGNDVGSTSTKGKILEDIDGEEVVRLMGLTASGKTAIRRETVLMGVGMEGPVAMADLLCLYVLPLFLGWFVPSTVLFSFPQ